MENYRALFAYHVEEKLLDKIRLGVNTGMAIEHDRFKDEIKQLTGRRIKPKKVVVQLGGEKIRYRNNLYLTPVIRIVEIIFSSLKINQVFFMLPLVIDKLLKLLLSRCY